MHLKRITSNDRDDADSVETYQLFDVCMPAIICLGNFVQDTIIIPKL